MELSRNAIRTAAALTVCVLILAACRTPASLGVAVQEDPRAPQPWRALNPAEQAQFALGFATFNTEWSTANSPAGRTDGLGPLFNAQSCDACHNSRRRGRGPRAEDDAPADLVIQLGRRRADGRIERGTSEYGHVLNTAAVRGFAREASVTIQYEESVQTLPDGSSVRLRVPRYQIAELSGPALAAGTVIMPRMPSSVQGLGLLERVPDSALIAIAKRSGGRVSWITTPEGPAIGRFGWQATEPTIASQTASALAREMGLTTARIAQADCGQSDETCLTAPNGGPIEIDAELFEAVVHFQSLHAVPLEQPHRPRSRGEKLFEQTGCTRCHRSSLPVLLGPGSTATINAYADLLLHDLGEPLADRDIDGMPVRTEWRTAPLWGISASVNSGQPLRLLHDGRARSVEEAILWHEGEASAARDRYARLHATARRTLQEWIEQL